MQLSKKQNICYQLFIAFLQSTSIFQHFEKEGQVDNSMKSDITDLKRSCYFNVFKAMF